MPYTRLYYHITWGTHKREPLIQPTFEASLYRVMTAKIEELGGRVFAIGGMDDHVHLAVSIPAKVSVSDFVGQVKGNSSHFVNHELCLPYHFGWQAEYGIVTFGQRNLNLVVEYIRHQRQHHAEQRVWRYLEEVDE